MSRWALSRGFGTAAPVEVPGSAGRLSLTPGDGCRFPRPLGSRSAAPHPPQRHTGHVCRRRELPHHNRGQPRAVSTPRKTKKPHRSLAARPERWGVRQETGYMRTALDFHDAEVASGVVVAKDGAVRVSLVDDINGPHFHFGSVAQLGEFVDQWVAAYEQVAAKAARLSMEPLPECEGSAMPAADLRPVVSGAALRLAGRQAVDTFESLAATHGDDDGPGAAA